MPRVPDAGRFTPTPVGKTSISFSISATLPVHPHARGEDLREIQKLNHNRFTPTPVGKTFAVVIGRPRLPVHPHARGEDEQMHVDVLLAVRFTPTHVGKTLSTCEHAEPSRFTPTRVGKTSTAAVACVDSCGSPPRAWGRQPYGHPATQQSSVHPHARGEDVRPTLAKHSCGSPPRTWGRREPALRARDHLSVHPHARGEDWRCLILSADCGSPPRTWGRHALAACGRALHRFTPTRVGKTTRDLDGMHRLAVHPHARGEDLLPRAARTRLLRGSPPRRGEDDITHTLEPARLTRFTPTHVGKTARRLLWRAFRAVHPHARGEDGLLACIVGLLIRFTPTHVGKTSSWPCRQTPWTRFTPTHVGKTLEEYIVSPATRFTPTRVGKTSTLASTTKPPQRFTPTPVGKTSWHGPGRRTSSRFTPTPVGKTELSRSSCAVNRFTPTHVGKTTPAKPERRATWRFTPTHVGKTWTKASRPDLATVHPHARGEDMSDAPCTVW